MFHAAMLSPTKIFGGSAIVLLGLSSARPAHALLTVGPEVGIVKRSADAPANLKLGVAYGARAEVSLLPLINFGPYYLHYQLGVDAPSGADAVFNVVGLRARLTLPVPGTIKPYAFAGAGYTWVNYTAGGAGDQGGRFLEIPIGVGVAYQVLEIFQFSLDGALRPG
ncbi:MAG TPA: outer membrane beta-barrel protein, partial [Polyangiaceae bacterium]|nr:outer membrane beta-barrel protein [Polyangiaceae bacterium]